MRPRATYRVQLHAGFPFAAAREQLDYLCEIGISHVYCSPVTQASEGSTHGYDVVDATRISDELGGERGFRALALAARERGMGLLIDIVPNHMCADERHNAWWRDVLEDGRASPFADFFDIDWEGDPLVHGKVLVPILSDHPDRVLAQGGLEVVWRNGAFLRYSGRMFPLAPASVARLLSGVDHEAVRNLVTRISALPGADPGDAAAREHRRRMRVEVGRCIGDVCRGPAAALVNDRMTALNKDRGELRPVLYEQNFQLSDRQLATAAINYRRFLDVTALVGMRVEDERTFLATHALLARLWADGLIDGVRVDHIDGLRDPGRYLRRLRALLGENAWIVAEKIVAADEALPGEWPVQGTTGYEFAAVATALLTDGSGEGRLAALFRDVTGDATTGAEAVRAGRVDAIDLLLHADIGRLRRPILAACAADPRHRHHAPDRIGDTVTELLCALDVYRTYVGSSTASPRDHAVITRAVERVRSRRPDLDPALVHHIGDAVLGRLKGDSADEFRGRFPQVSSAVAAKGVEDTAFYRFFPLVSQNEVGSQFDVFSVNAARFHECNARRVDQPLGLLATSTHDTKRSEDVRARVAVLSEIPVRWGCAVARWRDLLQGKRTGGLVDGATEYLFFQTAVGAHPWNSERAVAYMRKATMEAKRRTSWLAPDQKFDTAVANYVRSAFDDTTWRSDLAAFMPDVVRWGRLNSLSQMVLKLTSPGIPDVYQGTELWDDSLVDPDNRRAVDFDHRRRLLRNVRCPDAGDDDLGVSKLWTLRAVLQYRAERPGVFAGSYAPLAVNGPLAGHLVAFTRGENDPAVILVPRLFAGLDDGWDDATTVGLPGGAWHNILTGSACSGGTQLIAGLLADSPCAVLIRR